MNTTAGAATAQPRMGGARAQFAQTPAWIQDHPLVDLVAEAVYGRLARCADYVTWCVSRVSLAKLGEMIGRSIPTVKRGLARLREIGAITWKRGGFGLTNDYKLFPNRRIRQREMLFDGPPVKAHTDPPPPPPPGTTTRPIIPEPPENPVCKPVNRESESPRSPLTTSTRKTGGSPPPPSAVPTRSAEPRAEPAMRFARQFVAGVKKMTARVGVKMTPIRRRDLETIAKGFEEWNEPAKTWADVWEFWWQRRKAVNAFKAGCLVNPVQFAQQLGGLSTDCETNPDWHQWLADRRRKAVARV